MSREMKKLNSTELQITFARIRSNWFNRFKKVFSVHNRHPYSLYPCMGIYIHIYVIARLYFFV